MTTMARMRSPFRGMTLAVLVLLLAMIAPQHVEAVWTHSLVEGYETYYWNGVLNPKFRYQCSTGQWGHYTTVNSTWYALSAVGLTSTFIGDGAWYYLGTGLKYSGAFGVYRPQSCVRGQECA